MGNRSFLESGFHGARLAFLYANLHRRIPHLLHRQRKRKPSYLEFGDRHRFLDLVHLCISEIDPFLPKEQPRDRLLDLAWGQLGVVRPVLNLLFHPKENGKALSARKNLRKGLRVLFSWGMEDIVFFYDIAL